MLPSVQSVAKVSSNQPRVPGVDQWIAIKSCGYSSRDEAEKNALQLKDTILLAGANGFGVDFGTNKVRSSVSDAIKRDIKDKFGTVIRDEVHGIDVFEDGDVKHFMFEAHGTVQMDLPEFSKRVTEASAFPKLTRITRTGAELINDSLFVMPDEARFLLRISAIEALCEQVKRPQPVLDLIDELLKVSASLTFDSSAADTMSKVLMDARRQSVRQACLAKIRMRLGAETAREFDRLYGLRSKYLHKGRGRASLSAPANEALKIAQSLLFADIKGIVVDTSAAQGGEA
jgi:hypothetical protein